MIIQFDTPLTTIYPHHAPERPPEQPDSLGQGEQAQRIKSLHQRSLVGQSPAWDRFTYHLPPPIEEY